MILAAGGKYVQILLVPHTCLCTVRCNLRATLRSEQIPATHFMQRFCARNVAIICMYDIGPSSTHGLYHTVWCYTWGVEPAHLRLIRGFRIIWQYHIAPCVSTSSHDHNLAAYSRCLYTKRVLLHDTRAAAKYPVAFGV